MVCALTAYIDFCYIARRASLSETDLDDLDDALARYHKFRSIFQTTGVREPGPEGVSLPRQHAMVHYRELIEQFGSPNGLDSSITEAKHIKAVKEPWRRSSRYKELKQMLLTNQRLDKLVAARVDFEFRGMLQGTLFDWVWEKLEQIRERMSEDEEEDIVNGEGGGPHVDHEDENGDGVEEADGLGVGFDIQRGPDTEHGLEVDSVETVNPDEGWQVPNREDGGPVDVGKDINRVLLARTAREYRL